jgi:hypothetical protein
MNRSAGWPKRIAFTTDYPYDPERRHTASLNGPREIRFTIASSSLHRALFAHLIGSDLAILCSKVIQNIVGDGGDF